MISSRWCLIESLKIQWLCIYLKFISRSSWVTIRWCRKGRRFQSGKRDARSRPKAIKFLRLSLLLQLEAICRLCAINLLQYQWIIERKALIVVRRKTIESQRLDKCAAVDGEENERALSKRDFVSYQSSYVNCEVFLHNSFSSPSRTHCCGCNRNEFTSRM